MIDLAKLTPAPWTAGAISETLYDPSGAVLAHFYHGGTDETRAAAHAAMEFTALARQAMDVMMRRHWTVTRWVNEKWGVLDTNDKWIHPLLSYDGNAHDDPFTALVAADAWLLAYEKSP